MQDPTSLTSVAAFHQLFNHPVLESPQVPSKTRCELRVSLLAEELDELREAIAEKDIVGIADALCDLQYVLSGAVLEFGLGDQFKALFDEVQRSNMSKACNSLEEVEVSLTYYREQGVECHAEEKDGKYLLYRTADRKTLKSRFYSEADLERILKEI